MSVRFSSEICRDLATSEAKEWLITNGIGGFGAGTVSGLLTRRYHGLLIAALNPPLGRTLMLSKLNETVTLNNLDHDLYGDRWADDTVFPQGYKNLVEFFLVGTTPVWQYQIADALLEKRVWMQQGENTTYTRYTYTSGSTPITLSISALVNYRDYHGDTHSQNWQMQINEVASGIEVKAFSEAQSLYLFANANSQDSVVWKPQHIWHHNLALAVEKYRGLVHCEDHLLAGTCSVSLNPGESVMVVGSTNPQPSLDLDSAWQDRYSYEQDVLTKAWRVESTSSKLNQPSPQWRNTLVLSADQFVVDRPTTSFAEGKTIIAGYPWFGDWGRDTMISLPGITLATGRPSIARTILRTFAAYVDRGMLPNVFPDSGATPNYNTVDATLWYFEAIFTYYQQTQDNGLILELFPILDAIIDNYCRGTRYNIFQDTDGLIYGGEKGVQLTWMDAKVGDWVVTPRTGKAVEINALWYNALIVMEQLAPIVGQPEQKYTLLAIATKTGFRKFWSAELGYCYDVIDGINGNDDSLRPNQIFAVSLPSFKDTLPLLSAEQQKSIVDTVALKLLTPYGLRTLAPDHPDYQGHYGGDRLQRDGAYHQGTVWGWLIGHFIQAHLKVYQQPEEALCFLIPMAEHLETGCVGKISEIFDGDSPFLPRGCFSQAWSVAEVLRSWQLINQY